jgi:hypothetical protein
MTVQTWNPQQTQLTTSQEHICTSKSRQLTPLWIITRRNRRCPQPDGSGRIVIAKRARAWTDVPRKPHATPKLKLAAARYVTYGRTAAAVPALRCHGPRARTTLHTQAAADPIPVAVVSTVSRTRTPYGRAGLASPRGLPTCRTYSVFPHGQGNELFFLYICRSQSAMDGMMDRHRELPCPYVPLHICRGL